MSGLNIPIIIDKKLEFIQPNETLQQWAIRVRVPLQELVSEKKISIYHVHCLFGAFKILS
ncbi:8204_t:CDS:2 [Diversispora eburnea]|uniref:8204_t:CDS:1 n=1 Tax=Diversispora eburnea TaxID=1213867 RepID=A0A9N9CNG7_9GLOM|nr:8204_t:CDS:2 [Diversispora eburnea]